MIYSIGVDLGGTNLRIAAVDQSGQLLDKVTLGVRTTLGRDVVIRDMCEAIQTLTTKYKPEATLMGIGIGVPGIIDLHTGMVRESPNLPGWGDYPVRAEIEKRLGTQVVLENDANAAALGEKWLGAARHVEDMAILTLGTGVGGALMLRGELWHGMTGMAGEFGHMTLEPQGPVCKCGNRGCLEMYASATAVVRMAREAVSAGGSSEVIRRASADPGFSAKSVYELAVQGDETAQRIFARVGRALGIAIAGLINALNLPMYIVGGGVSGAWDIFSPALMEELPWRSMVYKATAPGAQPGNSGSTVTRVQLGSDAGLFGAARLTMITAANGR